ncbi:MAG: heat-inducible transcription repressor HrcA [Oscillospiraceae bacterium]|nr:heat-inducible transcription repressor HrcA [Oscillospiraceae bacterium]
MDDRKLRILSAVIDEYIVTGEPVGSKSIMDRVKASSATIRNEMAELEKQGYLEQPHTSAGRVPTYLGYRLYVDSLLQMNPLSQSEIELMNSMLPDEYASEEEIVNSASLALAELTKCATVVANATPKFSVISKVEVIPTGKRMYVILMITSTGSIKNKVCRLEFDLTNEQLAYFSNFMQENLEGIEVEALSDDLLERLETALGTYMVTLSPLVNEIMKMSREISAHEVSFNGELNLLTCDAFDKNEIMSFFDRKKEIAEFVSGTFSGLNVMFSNEKDGFVISNSSLITSSFSKGGRQAGTLGLLGPMRIDYAKYIPYLEYFTDRITQMLSRREDDEDN